MSYTSALLAVLTAAYDYAEELEERAEDNRYIEGYPSDEIIRDVEKIRAAADKVASEPDLEFLGEAVRHFIPTADWAEDNDGQLIIYTNLRIDENGDLVLC